MFPSLIFFVVLADLVISGSVSQVARSASIQCVPLTGAVGPLTIQSIEDGVQPPPPVQLDLGTNSVLQASSQPLGYSTLAFAFQNCTSSFVALDPPDMHPDNVTFYFGQLTLREDPSTCLTVSSSQQNNQSSITATPCDQNDDENQLYQFWQLGLWKDESQSSYVQWVGYLASQNATFQVLDMNNNNVIINYNHNSNIESEMSFGNKSLLCQPMVNFTGIITMQAQAPQNPQPPPVQVGLVNGNLRETNAAQTFIFQACASTWISQPQGTTPDVTFYYGHITLKNDNSTCLYGFPDTTPDPITSGPCDMTDGETQLTQFWQLAWNDNDPNPNAYIGFLGMNFNTDSDTPYAFQLLDGEAQTVPNPTSNMTLSSIYINTLEQSNPGSARLQT